MAGEAAVGCRATNPSCGRRRKHCTELDDGLQVALEALLKPVTRGHPESPLQWTGKSTRMLAEDLRHQNHSVGAHTVAALLHDAGHSL